MNRFGLIQAVTALLVLSGPATAQSYGDTLLVLRDLATRVDQARDASSPDAPSTLSRQREGWQRVNQTQLNCGDVPVVNGEVTAFGAITPFERTDGLDFAILSRGFALGWSDGDRAVSLVLSQRFEARNGEPTGQPFLEGSYFATKGVPTAVVVGPDRWVDTPRPASSPPLHQPWGAYLGALARHIRKCRLP